MEREQLVSTVKRAQAGDKTALNELFCACYNDVYYFALKTVKDEEIASDITQETFFEIIKTIGALKEPAAFVSWTKQITYHQCTRYFKKKKDVIVDEDEDGATVFDSLKEEKAEFIPDEALDSDEFKKTILAIIDELSEEQRSAVIMYYFDEMSVSQIAAIQGVSEGTVKSRLNYARKTIKASVEEYEKKNGIKLHAIPFFPLMSWLLKNDATSVSAAGTAAATATATTVAATTTVATATATAAVVKTAATGIGIKVLAGVMAACVAALGGGIALVRHEKENKEASSYAEENSSYQSNSKNDVYSLYYPCEAGKDYYEMLETLKSMAESCENETVEEFNSGSELQKYEILGNDLKRATSASGEINLSYDIYGYMIHLQYVYTIELEDEEKAVAQLKHDVEAFNAFMKKAAKKHGLNEQVSYTEEEYRNIAAGEEDLFIIYGESAFILGIAGVNGVAICCTENGGKTEYKVEVYLSFPLLEDTSKQWYCIKEF